LEKYDPISVYGVLPQVSAEEVQKSLSLKRAVGRLKSVIIAWALLMLGTVLLYRKALKGCGAKPDLDFEAGVAFAIILLILPTCG
jgi:hypothetical protein